jgi:hypothetical protein
VIRLVQVAATQLCGANIRVNAICPGLIETGMTQGLFDRARAEGKEAMIGHLNPLKRPPSRTRLPCAAVAAAAPFLASDESSYVNGHALVDGGLTSSLPFHRQMEGRRSRDGALGELSPLGDSPVRRHSYRRCRYAICHPGAARCAPAGA